MRHQPNPAAQAQATLIGPFALEAPRRGGRNEHPFISCSYRDCAYGRRCDDREESLQERLSLVVRSHLHGAALRKNPAPYLILLAVVRARLEAQPTVWPTLLRQARQQSFDLLTRRTVGLLKLYSLLSDTDHFIHCEQTLRLHVMNAIG